MACPKHRHVKMERWKQRGFTKTEEETTCKECSVVLFESRETDDKTPRAHEGGDYKLLDIFILIDLMAVLINLGPINLNAIVNGSSKMMYVT